MQGVLLCGESQLSDGLSDSDIRSTKRIWNIDRSTIFNKIYSPMLDAAFQSVIN